MLYQTQHHPFFFQFRSFTSIPPPPSTSPLLLPSSLQEMECVEAALKNSTKKEMALKSSPQAFLDDIWVVNAQNGVSSDDFSVDDLFDFTNEEDFLEQQQQQHEEEEEEEPSSSSPKRPKLSQEDHFSNDTTNFDYGSLSTDELAVPADDVANLEWLSHFVEDSFSEHSTAYPTGTLMEKPKLAAENLPDPEKPVTTTCFKNPVPAKARSKRARTGGRVWSLLASPSLTESSSSSTTTNTSSSSSSSPSSPCLFYSNCGWGPTFEPSEPLSVEKPTVKKHNKKQATDSAGGNGSQPTRRCSHCGVTKIFYSNCGWGPTFEPSEPLSVEKPTVKKHKKKQATDSAGGNGSQPTRRCSHCGVTKTPQWRAGPMGAKTLCNACGVRFKSGRLLPEYRPACSPTFSSELHSNHHRKVLEMRRKNELLGHPEPGLTPVVPSFG